MTPYLLLPPEQMQALAEQQLEQMRQARLQAERDREVARCTARNPNDPVPVTPEPPGYGWLLVLGPVVLVLGLVMLGLVLY